jgi:transposase
MSHCLRLKPSASITVEPHERLFVGIDAHSRSHHVTLWGRERGLVAQWVQPADSALAVERLMAHRDQIDLVVHEAGPTGYALVRALRAARLPAHVVAPSKMPLMIGEAKCDRLDSRRLAQFACQGLLRPIAVPTPQQEADRETVRARATVVVDVRRAKHRIRSFLLRHSLPQPRGWGPKGQAVLDSVVVGTGLEPCFESLRRALADDLARLRVLSREVSALAASERHARRVAHLSSVPGVGPITSMVFLTELFSPDRFGRGEEVASFIGLAPRVRSSGESRREGPVSKAGNVRLRTALIEAAWQWVRRDASARRRYGRHLSRVGSSQKAIVAMARRLAIVLWRLSVRGEDYRPGLA